MSSKPSKRDKFRGLLKDAESSMRHLFRSPSPAPSSSGTRPTKDVASTTLQTSLSELRKICSPIPVLKSFVDILTECLDNIPIAIKNREEYTDLAKNLTLAVDSLQTHLSQVNPTQMTKSIQYTIGELTALLSETNEKQARSTLSLYVAAEQDIDDLIRCYQQVENLFRRLQSDAVLNVWRTSNATWVIASETQAAIKSEHLIRLNPAHSARHDSIAASQVRRTGCTPNTRQRVLKDLQDWASDPQSAKVYWMNGMAGTGKTTISYSFCASLEAAHQLAASFFCSRSLPDCEDQGRILPTVAYQLARVSRPFHDALCRILGEYPDAGVRNVNTQFEKLVRDPLLAVKDKIPAGLLVVVIDALDECSSSLVTSSILDVLLRSANTTGDSEF